MYFEKYNFMHFERHFCNSRIGSNKNEIKKNPFSIIRYYEKYSSYNEKLSRYYEKVSMIVDGSLSE